MRSTSGQHYAGLDHLRALAAFLVVLWHFAHRNNNPAVPFGQSPEVGLLDESHCGVALFMTLSGYLFAKLIADRRIDYRAFLWNRAVRLLPLFVVALLIGGFVQTRSELTGYLQSIVTGLVLPTMPQGGWSIVVEFHFYIALPLLLWGSARWPWLPVAVVAGAALLRTGLLFAGFDVQTLAYYTILGRVDQFVLGIYFYKFPPQGRMAAALFAGLWLFYSWFDAMGGVYGHSSTAVWIFLPTVEALGFAALVSWYDRNPLKGRWLWPIQKAGDYSYATYLLHFLVVVGAADFVEQRVVALDSIYVAIPFALLFFAYMTMLGWVSHRFIEAPFARFRRPYIREEKRQSTQSTADADCCMAPRRLLELPAPSEAR